MTIEIATVTRPRDAARLREGSPVRETLSNCFNYRQIEFIFRVRKKSIVMSTLLSILIFNTAAKETNVSFFEAMRHDVSFTSANYVIIKTLWSGIISMKFLVKLKFEKTKEFKFELN